MFHHDRMHMLFILLAICCSVGVAHTLKYAQKLGLPMYGVFTVNYFIGSVIALIGGGFQLPPALIWQLGGLAVAMGCLFIGTFAIYSMCIGRLGVSIAVTVMRLAAVLPTLGSLLFFDALPKPLQIGGIALAFLALPFATKEKIELSDMKRMISSGFGWGLFLFAAFGVTEFLFKIQKELYPVQNSYQVLTIIFPTAFFIGLIYIIRHKQRITWKVALWGAILGTANLFSAFFFFNALKSLPGVIAYPMNGIGVILLTAGSSIVLWKDIPSKRNLLCILLASISLLLLYW